MSITLKQSRIFLLALFLMLAVQLSVLGLYVRLQAEAVQFEQMPISIAGSQAKISWAAGKDKNLAVRALVEGQSNLQNRMQALLAIMACLVVGNTALTAVLFVYGFGRRLERVHLNSLKLALKELPPGTPFIGDEITALDRALFGLAKSLEQATIRERAMIESAQDVVCTLDGSGCFLAANKATRDMLGVPADGVVGMKAADLIAPEDAGAWQKLLSQATNGSRSSGAYESLEADACGETLTMELKLKHFNGNYIDTLWTACWSPEEKKLFCVIRDTSEQAKTRRLKQELTVMVNDDLLNPVHSLQDIFAQLKSGKFGEISGEGAALIDSAERACSRLVQLTTDFLEDNKLEARKVQLNIERCSASDLVSAAVASLDGLAESRKVLVVVDVPALHVKGDATRLQQVLSNLISNAIKYSRGEGRVTVSAVGQNDFVVFSVVDRGLGISPTKLDYVFERYSQVQDPGHQEPGTGLGLSICKALVELHGGKIWVESKVGQGCQFFFSVPAG